MTTEEQDQQAKDEAAIAAAAKPKPDELARKIVTLEQRLESLEQKQAGILDFLNKPANKRGILDF